MLPPCFEIRFSPLIRLNPLSPLSPKMKSTLLSIRWTSSLAQARTDSVQHSTNPIGTLSNMICFISCLTSFRTRPILNVLKAFIALIPNKQGAIHPDNFRTVSPQNWTIKLGSKCLANHVQPFTTQRVHQDQTAFVKGRSISEKFIYATDAIQSCHSRKAFDLVSWHALIEVLKAKGFPERWCRWIEENAQKRKENINI